MSKTHVNKIATNLTQTSNRPLFWTIVVRFVKLSPIERHRTFDSHPPTLFSVRVRHSVKCKERGARVPSW